MSNLALTFASSAPVAMRVAGAPGARIVFSLPGPGALAMRIPGIQGPPGSSSGVTDGDKGDVTVSAGGEVWTINDAVVTDAKIVSLSWGKITDAPAFAAVATSGSAADLTGTLAAARIADGSLALGKLADLATGTILGRATAGTGTPEALTAAAVTALLDTFTAGTKGLAPASGGGTANFLRADGTWAAPPGGSPGGASGEVQFNSGGTFAGAADVEIEGGQLRLPTIATPATPAADGLKLFGRKVAGRAMPAFLDPSGLDSPVQPFFPRKSVTMFLASGNGQADTAFGGAFSATGTATAENVSTANLHTYSRRRSWRVTTASTTAVAGLRGNNTQWSIGGPAAGLGGFHLVWRWGPATGVSTATHRAFSGMRGSAAAPTDVDPSTLPNICGMGYDAADANVQFLHNDASGNAAKIDLGPSFPKPTADLTSVYEIALFAPSGATQALHYEVTDLVSGAVATGTVTTDLPTTTQLLTPYGYVSVGGTSSVIGFATMRLYIETDY